MSNMVPYRQFLGTTALAVTPGKFAHGLGPGAGAVCDAVTPVRPMAGAYSVRDVIGTYCAEELSAYVRQGSTIVEPIYASALANTKITDYVSLGNVARLRAALMDLSVRANFIPTSYAGVVAGTTASWTVTNLGGGSPINAFFNPTAGIRIRVSSTVQNSVAGTYAVDTLGFAPVDFAVANGGTVSTLTTGLANRSITFELTDPVASFEMYIPWAVQVNGREGGLVNALALLTDETEPAYRVRLQGVQTGSTATLDFISSNSPYASELYQGAIASRN